MGRGQTCLLLENTVEVTHASKAAVKGDLRYFFVAAEHFLGFLGAHC